MIVYRRILKRCHGDRLGRGSLIFFFCPKCSSSIHTQRNGFVWTVRPLSNVDTKNTQHAWNKPIYDNLVTDTQKGARYFKADQNSSEFGMNAGPELKGPGTVHFKMNGKYFSRIT